MTRRFAYIVVSVITLAALIAGIWYMQSQSPVPTQIKRQLEFHALLPTPDQSSRLDRQSFKYDANLKVLTFVVASSDTKNTISEQSTPDAFGDVPGYYDKLTESLHAYTSFDTDIGKVSLTRPAELKGGQSAVLNAKGVLLFAHPEKDLTDSQWRKFFNSLETIK